MRRMLLAVGFVAASSCAPQHIGSQLHVYTVDFTPYQQKDFLITPEAYSGDYESVGFVEIRYRPGVKAMPTKGAGVFGSEGTKYEVEPLRLRKALDELYERALEMGADAIMNFRMNSQTFYTKAGFVEGVALSGFAIKRLGAFD